MSRHTMFPVTFIAMSLLLSGCGQTGDLFLPENAQIEPVISSETEPVISGEIEPVIDSGDAQQTDVENNNQDEDSQDQP